MPKFPGNVDSACVEVILRIADVDHTQEPESRESMKTTHDQAQKCLFEAIRETSMRH